MKNIGYFRDTSAPRLYENNLLNIQEQKASLKIVKDDNDFTSSNRGVDTVEISGQLRDARNDLSYAKELKERINLQKTKESEKTTKTSEFGPYQYMEDYSSYLVKNTLGKKIIENTDILKFINSIKEDCSKHLKKAAEERMNQIAHKYIRLNQYGSPQQIRATEKDLAELKNNYTTVLGKEISKKLKLTLGFAKGITRDELDKFGDKFLYIHEKLEKDIEIEKIKSTNPFNCRLTKELTPQLCKFQDNLKQKITFIENRNVFKGFSKEEISFLIDIIDIDTNTNILNKALLQEFQDNYKSRVENFPNNVMWGVPSWLDDFDKELGRAQLTIDKELTTLFNGISKIKFKEIPLSTNPVTTPITTTFIVEKVEKLIDKHILRQQQLSANSSENNLTIRKFQADWNKDMTRLAQHMQTYNLPELQPIYNLLSQDKYKIIYPVNKYNLIPFDFKNIKKDG